MEKELIVISFPGFFNVEVQALTGLMERYDFKFLLRKPAERPESYDDFLSQLPPKLLERVIIHGTYTSAERYEAAGIH